MKRVLLAIPAALLLVTSFACSAPGQANRPVCADKFIQQQTQSTPVKGVFNCFSSDIQNAARAYAISDDAGIAKAFAPASGTAESRYVERSKDGGYVYEVTLTQDGKVVTDTYAAVYVQNNRKSVDYGKVYAVKATQ